MNVPPPEFFCPITSQIMKEPVMTIHGFSFEREALLRWMDRHSPTCPLTRQDLSLGMVVPDCNLQFQIESWRRRGGGPSRLTKTTTTTTTGPSLRLLLDETSASEGESDNDDDDDSSSCFCDKDEEPTLQPSIAGGTQTRNDNKRESKLGRRGLHTLLSRFR